MDTLGIVDNGGDRKNDINCSGICQSLTASRRNADMEFIVWCGFILNSSRIQVNCQKPASLITTIDELERAHPTVSKSLFFSLSLSPPPPPPPPPLSLSSSLLFLSHPGDFQPPPSPPPLIPSSNRENTHCLSNESGVVVQKYRELVDSCRVASRITVTYRARINPCRLCNLSPFPCVPFPSFAHRHFFFSLPLVPLDRLLVLLADRCHACIPMPITSRFSNPRERTK